MPQRSIRFPDELAAAVEAEAVRRGKPHTFSSVLLEWAFDGYTQQAPERASRRESMPRPPTPRTPAAPEGPLIRIPAASEKPSVALTDVRHRPQCKCTVCKPPRNLMEELKASLEPARKPRPKAKS